MNAQIPPKYYKNPVKQQYYQQQYLNEFLKYLNSKQIKYNVVAIKSKYHNVPYYVVSIQAFRRISSAHGLTVIATRL